MKIRFAKNNDLSKLPEFNRIRKLAFKKEYSNLVTIYDKAASKRLTKSHFFAVAYVYTDHTKKFKIPVGIVHLQKNKYPEIMAYVLIDYREIGMATKLVHEVIRYANCHKHHYFVCYDSKLCGAIVRAGYRLKG